MAELSAAEKKKVMDDAILAPMRKARAEEEAKATITAPVKGKTYEEYGEEIAAAKQKREDNETYEEFIKRRPIGYSANSKIAGTNEEQETSHRLLFDHANISKTPEAERTEDQKKRKEFIESQLNDTGFIKEELRGVKEREQRDAAYKAAKGSSFSPTTGNLPEVDAELLLGKQNLAAEIKSYVDSGKNISMEDATRMNTIGAGLDLKPKDLGRLYNQYKTDKKLNNKNEAFAAAQAVKPDPKFGTPLSDRSTSSLNQPTRRLGTLSGDMRRASRRLRGEGYKGEAGQMAAAAAMQGLNEPSILTEEQRKRQSMQNQESDAAIQDTIAAQAEQAKYMRDLYKKRQADLDKGISPPYTTQQTAGATQ